MERLKTRIGFLCTGDEILSGEILDTNAPYFSQRLTEHGFELGQRIVTSDNQAEMEDALRFLLQEHKAVITLGGLGPTSDDRTRFAVASALNEALVFNEECWEHIIELFQRLGNLALPENNRQQCLFPKQAIIYPNPSGSAAACGIEKNNQWVFMLPGPPNECRAIFDTHVLPTLLALQPACHRELHRHTWLLLGASEGNVSDRLDRLVENSNCEIGYRVDAPYLEVKLRSMELAALNRLIPAISEKIQAHLVGQDKKKASRLLLDFLVSSDQTIAIDDQATYGHLLSHLAHQNLVKNIRFISEPADIKIKIKGMDSYWNQIETAFDEVKVSLEQKNKQPCIQSLTIPLRNKKTMSYAVEFICAHVLKFLRED